MLHDDDLTPDDIRSSAEVAKRALALFAPVGVALGASREVILNWLAENSLLSELTPYEARFLNDPQPDHRDLVNFSWHSERLAVLLWALKLTDIPAADEQFDTEHFQLVLPPYADITTRYFTQTAALRQHDELLGMADQLLAMHRAARDAKIHDRPPVQSVDIEIIQERHHAINWIIGYDGLPWDEVTTDT